MTPFARALEQTLRFEGGVANHPYDRGGLTNQGITQRTYDNYRTSRRMALRPVTKMEDQERDSIYRDTYWTPCGCDLLPPALACAVFDMAVHSGPWNAKLTLQRAVLVRADGVIGPVTISAAASVPDALLRFLKKRGAVLQDAISVHPNNVVFLEGWISRLLDQAWAGGSP